jgi:hypothetical protein
MEKLYVLLKKSLLLHDSNQPLTLNEEKKKIKNYRENPEHLGLRLGKQELRLGKKTRAKLDRVKSKITQGKRTRELKNTKSGLMAYKAYIEKINLAQTKNPPIKVVFAIRFLTAK